MRNPSRRIAVTSCVAMLLLTTYLEAKAQSKQETSSKALALGVVLQSQHDAVKEHFSPFVNYVARKLTPAGDAKGMVVVAPTAGQMIKLLDEKRVDFYIESPYPTYIINRLGAARLLLRRWKGGIAEYRASFSPTKKAVSRDSKTCAAKSSLLKTLARRPVISCPSSFYSRKDFP